MYSSLQFAQMCRLAMACTSFYFVYSIVIIAAGDIDAAGSGCAYAG
jgi:hypothetical protein